MSEEKPKDEYRIDGSYNNGPWEEIDTCETKEMAEEYVREYRFAFGSGWRFNIVYRPVLYREAK